MRLSIRCVLLVAASVASGCSTVATKSADGWGTPYSGARCSYHALNAIRPSGQGELAIVALAAVDVPLSLVADTALLPVDLALRSDGAPRACPGWR